MCVYCYAGDFTFKHDPPWQPLPHNPWHPNIPMPLTRPIVNPPWEIDRLKEFQELLERIKKLEAQVDGCECVEPDKPDYVQLVKDRIEQLEKKVSKKFDDKNKK